MTSASDNIAPHLARLGESRGKIRQSLGTGLLPYWARHGWDTARGGLHERLDSRGSPLDLGYRRLTVAARQLLTFSWGTLDFGRDPSADAAHRCFDYLLTRFRDPRHDGWFFKLDLDGAPLDDSKDLYATGFVIMGLTAYARAFASGEAKQLAAQTLALVQEKFTLPGGWFAKSAGRDWTISDPSLETNPHMHLLEAAIHVYQATGSDLSLRFIDQIVGLYRRHFLDASTGSLREFFDGAANPHPQQGHIREPGHHFEWYWLLQQEPLRQRHPDVAPLAERMLAWGEAFGIDRQFGGIFDQVDGSGGIVTATKRIWPVTEAIKAFAAAYIAKRQPADLRRVNAMLDLIFDTYRLAQGRWVEWLNRDLTLLHDWMPPTTCYHLYLGLMEAVRLAEGLEAGGAAPALTPPAPRRG
jgi:mannose-6-phosphate isomerase